jgi:hypothetical protein
MKNADLTQSNRLKPNSGDDAIDPPDGAQNLVELVNVANRDLEGVEAPVVFRGPALGLRNIHTVLQEAFRERSQNARLVLGNDFHGHWT